jgi:hypothetical protein
MIEIEEFTGSVIKRSVETSEILEWFAWVRQVEASAGQFLFMKRASSGERRWGKNDV